MPICTGLNTICIYIREYIQNDITNLKQKKKIPPQNSGEFKSFHQNLFSCRHDALISVSTGPAHRRARTHSHCPRWRRRCSGYDAYVFIAFLPLLLFSSLLAERSFAVRTRVTLSPLNILMCNASKTADFVVHPVWILFGSGKSLSIRK